MNELFSRLDKLRINKGLALVDLGRIVGASPQNVQRWKKGGTIVPNHLNKLAIYFEVSVDWLLTGRDNITTKLSYGMRERLFEAKGATGLSVPELANLMGVDVKDVERVMNTGGSVSGAFLEAFERGLQPRIDAIKTRKAVVAPCPNCARLESELTRANRIIDTILKK